MPQRFNIGAFVIKYNWRQYHNKSLGPGRPEGIVLGLQNGRYLIIRSSLTTSKGSLKTLIMHLGTTRI
jgi:hypothetical protein